MVDRLPVRYVSKLYEPVPTVCRRGVPNFQPQGQELGRRKPEGEQGGVVVRGSCAVTLVFLARRNAESSRHNSAGFGGTKS